MGPMAAGVVSYGDYVVNGSMYYGITPLDGITAVVGAENIV